MAAQCSLMTYLQLQEDSAVAIMTKGLLSEVISSIAGGTILISTTASKPQLRNSISTQNLKSRILRDPFEPIGSSHLHQLCGLELDSVGFRFGIGGEDEGA